jgi:glucose dehydrogenase
MPGLGAYRDAGGGPPGRDATRRSEMLGVDVIAGASCRASVGPGLALCALLSGCAGSTIPTVKPGEWPAYARDPGGMRHSPLTQVNRDNVAEF